MNIFQYYQKRIFDILKILEKKKILKIPKKFKGLTVELPPKNKEAAISCNAALILAKHNNISSLDLAKILKKNLLIIFKEYNQPKVIPNIYAIEYHLICKKPKSINTGSKL